ncbi:MAG: DNA polymerase III subunit chi [Holosporaceae bacterium]|jgi:DNA polymerase-3 subunit chi|nr:DNA polymerase III subunit chi [Holosporaceae bacterium]
MELNFYHVAEGNLISSVIRLLEKVYVSEQRCIFFSPLEERVKVVDKMLWTFSTNAFIPHGDKSLGFREKQPIYFANEIENPNNAEVLVIADSLDYKLWNNFERVFLIFEEKTDNTWSTYSRLKNSQENVNYWKQLVKGWEKL